MFENKSFAGTGWLVLLLSLVARHFGLDLDDAEITELALALATVGGFLAALWGQIRRKDLKYGLFRV